MKEYMHTSITDKSEFGVHTFLSASRLGHGRREIFYLYIHLFLPSHG